MSGMGMDEAIDLYQDPKPLPRLRDPEVFKRFHEQASRCLICGTTHVQAHHLLRRSQGGDDVLANLVALCEGCHEALHRASPLTRMALGDYILSERGAEALRYLRSKRSDGWIEKRFGVELTSSDFASSNEGGKTEVKS